MMTAIGALLRVLVVLGTLLTAALAMLAFFGFAVSGFDLFNHAQPFLLAGTVIGLLLVMMVFRGGLRLAVGGMAALGILASAAIVVPEFLAGARPLPLAGDRPVITLMTHNVFGVNYRMDEVSAAILNEDADILVFQEYFGEQATALHPLLAERYPYFVSCRGGKRANLGLYSRIPFEQVEDGACPENAYTTERTAHILAHFTTPEGKSFSVMTTHMDWPMPVARQHRQLEALRGVVETVDGPLILAGDFNSTPWSYALRNFVADAGLTRVTANLWTYPTRWHMLGRWWPVTPVLPLDQVMVRDGVTVHAVRTGAKTASDHLPVMVEFSLD